MPMVQVKGQDNFMQFPDDMSLDDIRRFLASKFSDQAITSAAKSILEPAATIASGIVAEPVAGLAGIAALPLGADKAATAVETVRDKLTFEPRSAEGKAGLDAVGSALAPIGEALEGVSRGAGDFVLDKTGSPLLAAAAHSAPTLALELLGLKGANQLGKAGKLGQQLEFGDIGSQGIGKQRGAVSVGKVKTAKNLPDLESAGFDTDFPITHGSRQGKVTEIKKGQVFDGVFGSAGEA